MKGTRPLFMISCVLAVAVICTGCKTALGGGPILLKAPGQPVVWANGGRNIAFNPDRGGLGPMTNAEAVAQTVAAFGRWESVPLATATYVNAGSLPFDVDETNFVPVLFGPPDGTNPIVYDENGAISTLIFGEFSGILGLAGFDYDPETDQIVRGLALLNGGHFLPGLPVSESTLFSVQVHEFGHYSGLDHSVVNGEIFTTDDTTGPTPHDTFPRPVFPGDNIVETMYPLIFLDLVDGQLTAVAGQETPHADDISTLSALYPEPGFFANSGTITGRVLGSNGTTPLNGVNVIARNLANPFGDAVSAISGALAGSVPDDHPLAGVYILNGLTPGEQYAVYVDQILIGQFATPPRLGLPGPEEFYNGPEESDNPDTDHPGEFTPLTAVAGPPLTGIDIIFNRLLPGPIPIDVFFPDAGFTPWVELPLPFPFEVGGQRFDSVFLNAFQGTLTFGQPDFTPFGFQGRTTQHVTGEPPRISGLNAITDLFSGGTVSFDQTNDTLTVQYTDVPTLLPDFSPGGSHNTFSIALHAKKDGQGNRTTLSYGQIDARYGLAGYSCGNRITSGFEPESDLSALAARLIRGQGQSAIYEEFGNLDNDLDNLTVTFEMPGAFADRFEPNNSQAGARRINLPFNTAEEYADITAGDVDFYRFRAKAGEILVAETVPGGPLDTIIGLFGPGGMLLATNDDNPFLFSRLIFTIPADGEYALAVTTFPDFDFTGAGEAGGRYVLTLNTYRGTVLPLGDDDAVELPLRFAFPFQGADWTSVWVNSDGSLTFGAGDTDITARTVPRFLAGPPRIAPLFADLDPTGFGTGVTGLVIAEEKDDSVTLRWVSVPRFSSIRTNTFSVNLNAEGDIHMEWSDMRRAGRAVVGITEGYGAANAGPTDLSQIKRFSAGGTTYEQFLESIVTPFNVPSFDLHFDEVRFVEND